MSRILKFYETRFRHLAKKLGQPEIEFVQSSFYQAAELSKDKHLNRDLALALIHAGFRRTAAETEHYPFKFLCDAGLGGMARWLRAAGYESFWKPALDDAAVIRETERLDATLITTDTMMMERGVLRDNLVPSVCVPSSLTCPEQLTILFHELGLSMREPRCMACGGELISMPKQSLISRIPPKTALWLDDYFVCAQCDQLFWRGTHWRKIMQKLETLNETTFDTKET